MTPQQYRLPFKLSTLALAVSATLPLTAVHAETEKELTTVEVHGQERSAYKVDKASSVKLTQPIADTPKSITIISGDLLKEQGVTNLNDALRNVAGVSTFGGGEGGGGIISANDRVTIRGFDSSSNIYLDGIRDVAGYNRDLFNYENVEVIKGASGSLDGRSTGGGSVNLSTKRARLDSFGSVTTSYDTLDTKRIALDANQEIGTNSAGRLNLLYSDGGDTFDNGIENYETLGAGGSLLFKLGNKTTLHTDVFLMKQDNTPLLGLPFVTKDASQGYTDTTTNVFYPGNGMPEGPIASGRRDENFLVSGRDYEKVDTQMYTVELSHIVSDNLTVRSQSRYGQNDKDSVLSRAWWGKKGNVGLLDATYTQAIDQENKLFVTQLDALINFEFAGMRHDLVAGIEYANEKRTTYNHDDSGYVYTDVNGNDVTGAAFIDPRDPAGTAITVTGKAVRDGSAEKSDANTAALYLFDTVRLHEKLILDANLRYEDYSLEGSGKRRGRGNSRIDIDGKVDTSYLSGGVALTYKPVENGSVYLGYSDSKQPSNADLQIDDEGYINKLKPQTAKTVELGSKWELFDQRLLLTGAVFQTEKTVFDTETDVNNVSRTYLAGEQRARGFELSATGAITEDLSLLASYTKLKTKVTKDFTAQAEGLGLQSSPEDTANLWLSYKTLSDALVLGAGLNYNSGETFWRRDTAYYVVDSYVTSNLMASYAATDALKLQFNINNLTDKDYVTDYSAKGHFMASAPRSYMLGLTYDF